MPPSTLEQIYVHYSENEGLFFTAFETPNSKRILWLSEDWVISPKASVQVLLGEIDLKEPSLRVSTEYVTVGQTRIRLEKSSAKLAMPASRRCLRLSFHLFQNDPEPVCSEHLELDMVE